MVVYYYFHEALTSGNRTLESKLKMAFSDYRVVTLKIWGGGGGQSLYNYMQLDDGVGREASEVT